MRDPGTFDAFYSGSVRRVTGQLYAMTGSRAEAEDCVQEAYARAWQRWDKVSGYGDPEAWVRTVAYRVSVSTWRKAASMRAAHRRHGVPDDLRGLSPDYADQVIQDDRLALAGRDLPQGGDDRHAGGASTAYASFDRPGLAPQAKGASPAPLSGVPWLGRPEIAAVTTKGALVVLNPLTGVASRILVASGVVGDAVSVSPNGATVYFTARRGCVYEVESVPTAGGRPTAITPGVMPAISPDGTRLAFAREPFGGGSEPYFYATGCHQPGRMVTEFNVVVRDLRDGHEAIYPTPPGAASNVPYPVSRLSWAPDGRRLLVSVGPSQDNEGWDLVEIDPATSRYYLPSSSSGASAVPVAAGRDAARSYYREGVFLPGGDVFVNRTCCAGVGAGVTSSLLWEIDPSGHLVRQVAIGFLDRDHHSLDADPAGHWLLYLSGHDLFVSLEGNAPFLLTSGLTAAAWV